MTTPDNLLSRQDWIVTHQPTAPEVERVTRTLIDQHEHWDRPHHFFTYCRLPDGHLDLCTAAGIDTHITPPQYPRVLARVLADQLAARYVQHPGAPPVVALALQYEAFGIAVSEHGPTVEQEQARLTRSIYMLPEREETCGVITADVGGRVWHAQKYRATGTVDCRKWEPMAVDAPGGQLVQMVRDFAATLPEIYLEQGVSVPAIFKRAPQARKES